MNAPRYPGLAKVRSVPLVRQRIVRLLSMLDGRWRDVLEDADVISEGTVRNEGERLVYYGSTNLLLRPRRSGGELPDDVLEQLGAFLRHDPHMRVRAVRVAHREASVRAGSPIGALAAELSVHVTPHGVVISVDVVARVVEGRRGSAKREAP